MPYHLFLVLVLLANTTEAAYAKEEPVPAPTEEEVHHPKVMPSLHAGVAFRFDFEEETPGTEPFLVVGAGMTARVNERLAFVPLLTAAVAPTGTWGFGVNAELEVEVWKHHLAVDVLLSVYQESNIHEHHTEFVFAHGLGLSAIFGQGTTLTVGGQMGVDLESGREAFYPYFDVGIPISVPGRRPKH